MGGALWLEPDSLDELKKILAEKDPQTRLVSGGTALALIMKQGMFDPDRLVSLKKLKNELSYIKVDEDGNLRIGGMTTLREIEVSETVARFAPVIVNALHQVANPRIRYVASIGGNLSYGDAHLDLPPILMAMGAKVKIESLNGERWLELNQFFKGYYETALEMDEILTELVIPKPEDGLKGTYIKYTTLSNDDWPTVGVAAFLKINNNLVEDARIVISAATDKPTQLIDVENILINNNIDNELINSAAEKAFKIVEPLEDLRGSVWYKKEMVKVHVRRALERLIEDR